MPLTQRDRYGAWMLETAYRLPANAWSHIPLESDFPGSIVTIARLETKSTSTLLTPSMFERVSRTLAVQPLGQVMPSMAKL